MSDGPAMPGDNDASASPAGGSRVYRSLGVRLLWLILALSVVFTVVSAFVQLSVGYQQDIALLDERMERVRQSHLPALSISVWNLDTRLIDTQLDSLLSLHEVHGLILETAYGDVFRRPRGAQLQDLHWREFALHRQQPNGRPVVYLGTLKLGADMRQINNRTVERLWLMLLTESVWVFLLSFAILFLVQQLITRHLAAIAAYLRRLHLENLGKSLTLGRRGNGTRDELDVFVEAFNDLRERLVNEIQLLEQTRSHLADSEEKYRLSVEATRDGLWDWDVVSGTVNYSPGWTRIIGEQSVEPVYASWESRIHPSDREAALHALNRHLAGDLQSWHMEHRLRRQDGSWVWVLGRGQVVKRDATGRVLRMVGTMTDISDKKEQEQAVWRQANYDGLTGLPNRKLFLDLLGREIRNAKRENRAVWALFVDLDGFKEINDAYGHQAGDLMLARVADRLTATVRETDIVARLAGDEFVVVLTGDRANTYVDRVACQLIETISRAVELKGENLYVTASIGIASFPNDADNASDLIKFADQSMYEAKRQGKNRFHYFTTALQRAAQVRIEIAKDLHKAIDQQEFQLYFQPVIDLHRGHVRKAEVLLRWFHPDKGLISPAGFIPVAEETGVIEDLGRWVFEQALDEMARWESRLDDDFQLSINVSPLQLRGRSERQAGWLGLLRERSLPARRLVIEITEGLLLTKDASVGQALLQCRDAGVQIAIDDFGTGYSSLAYLKELDIDYLKVDQSFTRNLGSGSIDDTLVEAIVVMAHKLDLEVIAEGIETRQQLDVLRAMHCDYGQGYYFARPMPAADFEQYLFAEVQPERHQGVSE